MKAFFILGVNPDADDSEIEAAYHKMVRKYPPDMHPEKFNQIVRAREQIGKREDRILYLMNTEHAEPDSRSQSYTDEVLAAIRMQPDSTHLSEKDFYIFLKS